jgi:hypothetical protein
VGKASWISLVRKVSAAVAVALISLVFVTGALWAAPVQGPAWADNDGATTVSATITVAAVRTSGQVLAKGSNAPIAGATVVISGTTEDGRDFTRTATTDANGNYVFPGIPIGVYNVTANPPAGSDYLSGKLSGLDINHNDYQVPTIYLAFTKVTPSGNHPVNPIIRALAQTGERLGPIGLTLIAIFLFLGILFIILFLLARRRKRDDDDDDDDDDDGSANVGTKNDNNFANFTK